MTALVERDEAKRLINAHVAECFRLAGHKELPVILHPGPVADAILALRQPGAEYRRAVEDAARVAEGRAGTRKRGQTLAAAIRALSDTKKGGRDGE